MLHRCPGMARHGFLEIVTIRESHVEVGVHLHEAHKAHLQQGNIFRPKQPRHAINIGGSTVLFADLSLPYTFP